MPLALIEDSLENFVEGAVLRLFGGRVLPREIALRLARALEDSAAAGAMAGRYIVRLHPEDAQAILGRKPHWPEELAAGLVVAARQIGLKLAYTPEVLILPDGALRRGQLAVTLGTPLDNGDLATQEQTPVRRPVVAPVALNAFLVLDGERLLPLTEPVIRVGRRLDNHIILNSPRVSRAHAQLRLRFGHYILYDLGSTAGTLVNGQPVSECLLRSGDVIDIGGVMLIYGEDEGGSASPDTTAAAHYGGTATRPLDYSPGA